MNHQNTWSVLLKASPAAVFGLPGAVIAGVIIVAAIVRSEASLVALEAAAQAAPASSSTSAASAGVEPLRPRERAPAEDLAAARAQGAAALARLAEQYPRDPAVLKAWMLAHQRDPNGQVAALQVARQWLGVSDAAAEDEEVRRLVLAAANGSPDVAAEAFELMSNRMGSRGPDLLYELSTTTPVLKDRAERLLADAAVVGRASPALRIALELRAAASCQAKKPLLGRASEVGDERAVAILSPLVVAKPRGCGLFGVQACPAPCSSIATEIRAAIAAMQARGPK